MCLRACARLEREPPSSPPSSLCRLFKPRERRVASLILTSSPTSEFSLVSNPSERMVAFFEHHGSQFVLVAPPLSGAIFRDWAPPQPASFHPPQELEKVPQRWGDRCHWRAKPLGSSMVGGRATPNSRSGSIQASTQRLACWLVTRRSSPSSIKSGIGVVLGGLLFLKC